MKKQMHAVQFDGTTFGMPIDITTAAYKNFKKNIKIESAVNYFGTEFKIKTVPYLLLASIMEDAQWLVSEDKCFNSFYIGNNTKDIVYVKYSDNVIDFRCRKRV